MLHIVARDADLQNIFSTMIHLISTVYPHLAATAKDGTAANFGTDWDIGWYF